MCSSDLLNVEDIYGSYLYLKMTISGVATTMNNDDHNDLEDYGTPGIDPMDNLDKLEENRTALY